MSTVSIPSYRYIYRYRYTHVTGIMHKRYECILCCVTSVEFLIDLEEFI